MAGEFAGKAAFGKINIDESELASQYSVEAIPTTLIMKDGEVSGTIVGADPNAIRAEIEKLL